MKYLQKLKTKKKISIPQKNKSPSKEIFQKVKNKFFIKSLKSSRKNFKKNMLNNRFHILINGVFYKEFSFVEIIRNNEELTWHEQLQFSL